MSGLHWFSVIFNLYTENIRREVLEPLVLGEEALEFEGRFDLFSIGGIPWCRTLGKLTTQFPYRIPRKISRVI